jgi:hypothetical protein
MTRVRDSDIRIIALLADLGLARTSVSKRPIWLEEAACLSTALPPTFRHLKAYRQLPILRNALQEHLRKAQADSAIETIMKAA